MFTKLFEKIKSFFRAEEPKIIEVVIDMIEKEEKELEPKIEEAAKEIKDEVVAKVKRVRKKK